RLGWPRRTHLLFNRLESMNTCYKHGTPLRETMDALSGVSLGRECGACELYRQADARQTMASKDTDKDRAAKHMEICERLRAKALMLCGRWFQVKKDGEVWDMSEKQIEAARQHGATVEVITQIV